MAEARTIVTFLLILMLFPQRSTVELHERILELKPTLYKLFYYKTQSGAASARAVLQCARQCHHEEGCRDTFSVTDDGTCVVPSLPSSMESSATYSKYHV